MTAKTIMQAASDKHGLGWDDETMLAVVNDYLEKSGEGASFAWFVARTAANDAWDADKSDQARAQGWDIFEIDGDAGRPAIQRLDETMVFASDDDAMTFVKRRALDGDYLAQTALEIVE